MLDPIVNLEITPAMLRRDVELLREAVVRSSFRGDWSPTIGWREIADAIERRIAELEARIAEMEP